nr:glucosaminidase domain-containing protein [Echinimonas agarilytica]
MLQSIDSRINTVPVALALAQAAKESGWGTSRFARQGNNLFGQWCFSKGCGLVPLQRKPGAKHEVATFDSPAYSVDAYVRNINANGAYQLLRQHRQSLQNQAMPELVKALILGLGSYSERGQAYVHEVDAMIDNNPSWLAYPAVVEKHPPTL